MLGEIGNQEKIQRKEVKLKVGGPLGGICHAVGSQGGADEGESQVILDRDLLLYSKKYSIQKLFVHSLYGVNLNGLQNGYYSS